MHKKTADGGPAAPLIRRNIYRKNNRRNKPTPLIQRIRPSLRGRLSVAFSMFRCFPALDSVAQFCFAQSLIHSLSGEDGDFAGGGVFVLIDTAG